MKIAIILGTRPEIIKLCSIIKYCEENKLDHLIIHTNQHYSANMDRIFFDELELPHPKYNLNVGSGSREYQLDKASNEIEKVLLKEKPDIVIVQGDTNTVLAGALAASKLKIKVAHVEAGLRSYDKRMPEEINRIMTDNVSDFLFAPTERQENILLNEKIDKHKIFVVGNTVVDAVFQNIELAEKKISMLNNLNLNKQHYFLVTLHRPSNVDQKSNLENLFNILEKVSKEFNTEIVYPIHPRTRKMADSFNIKPYQNIKLIEPLGFLEFLQLEKNAKLIITDSGGVQEEACILKTPCVTLRENTERPETVDVGANIVAGLKVENVIESIKKMLKAKKDWSNPFGDGSSGKKIMEIILKK